MIHFRAVISHMGCLRVKHLLAKFAFMSCDLRYFRPGLICFFVWKYFGNCIYVSNAESVESSTYREILLLHEVYCSPDAKKFENKRIRHLTDNKAVEFIFKAGSQKINIHHSFFSLSTSIEFSLLSLGVQEMILCSRRLMLEAEFLTDQVFGFCFFFFGLGILFIC